MPSVECGRIWVSLSWLITQRLKQSVSDCHPLLSFYNPIEHSSHKKQKTNKQKHDQNHKTKRVQPKLWLSSQLEELCHPLPLPIWNHSRLAWIPQRAHCTKNNASIAHVLSPRGMLFLGNQNSGFLWRMKHTPYVLVLQNFPKGAVSCLWTFPHAQHSHQFTGMHLPYHEI